MKKYFYGDMEVKLLRDRVKSDIVNAGLRSLFDDESFLGFWDDYWDKIEAQPSFRFVSKNYRLKSIRVKHLAGLILGIFFERMKPEPGISSRSEAVSEYYSE